MLERQKSPLAGLAGQQQLLLLPSGQRPDAPGQQLLWKTTKKRLLSQQSLMTKETLPTDTNPLVLRWQKIPPRAWAPSKQLPRRRRKKKISKRRTAAVLPQVQMSLLPFVVLQLRPSNSEFFSALCSCGYVPIWKDRSTCCENYPCCNRTRGEGPYG